MGTWGYCLFQSDHDFDMISDLTGETGLYELEEKATEDAKSQEGGSTKDDEEKDKGPYISYSIYAPQCSDPEFVRKHLDTGVLDELFTKKKGYEFVLLGACAMSLGCKVRTSVRQHLKARYDCSGLMHDAEDQMHAALMGPKAYKSGEPFDFDSPGLIETANQDKSDRQPNKFGFFGMNVASPGGFFAPPPRSTPKLKKTQPRDDEKMFGADRCAGCGMKEDDNVSLLCCAKCKSRKYCGKECQKQHWKLHKEICVAPEAGKKSEME